MSFGAIAGTVATAAIGAGASKLFGPDAPSGPAGGGGAAALTPFKAGGLKFGFDPSGRAKLKLKKGSERDLALRALMSSFGQQASDIRGTFAPGIESAFGQGIQGIEGLLEQVSPGFGALTEARRKTLTTRGTAAKSDLRARLAQRRVLGSSFAQDIENRQEQQLSQDLAEAEATSFLEELQATNQLINQRTELSVQQAQSSLQNALAAFESERAASGVSLDEQNRQLEVMTQLISGATATIGANARLEAELASQSAAGRGAAFAPIAKSVGDAVGGLDIFKNF